jgi:hypothetical protein
MMIWKHGKFSNYSIYMNMNFFQIFFQILIIIMWFTQDLKISYMCLISPFSPSNVDIIDSYFYMSFLIYITSHYVDYMNFF